VLRMDYYPVIYVTRHVGELNMTVHMKN